MTIKQTVYIFIALCTLFSCNRNPYHKDVSDIKVSYNIQPFHSDVKKFTEQPNTENFSVLKQKYNSFLYTYTTDLKRSLPIIQHEDCAGILIDFFNDRWIQELYRISDSVWQSNYESTTEKLTKAFQYYKYYFPENDIPQLYTFITGINYSMAIDSNIIAIGIDKYLGANCDFYNTIQIESYIKRNMHINKIPSDLMRALAENDMPEMFEEDYLLAKMLQCGRYQYFVRCMLPDEPDSLLWGFTGKQLDFCNESEGEFWKYLLNTDDILFSTDYITQKRFIDDAPFTSVFTKDSPGRIGQWIGFKIIESFMQNNPDISLKDLFSIKSSKYIMRKAKYNPQ